MMMWWRIGVFIIFVCMLLYYVILLFILIGDKILNFVYIVVYFKLFYFFYEVLFNRL